MTLSLSTLPKYLQIHILNHLSHKEIAIFSQVSKGCNALANHESLWKFLYHRDFAKEAAADMRAHLDRFNTPYKEAYKNSFIFSKNFPKGICPNIQLFKNVVSARGNYLFMHSKHIENDQTYQAMDVYDTKLGKSYTIKHKQSFYVMAVTTKVFNRMLIFFSDSPSRLDLVDIDTNTRITTIECTPILNSSAISDLFLKYFFIDIKGTMRICDLKTGKFSQLSLNTDESKNLTDHLLYYEQTDYYYYDPTLPFIVSKFKFGKDHISFQGPSDKRYLFNLETNNVASISVSCDYDECHPLGSSFFILPKQVNHHEGKIYQWNLATGAPLSDLDVKGAISQYSVNQECILVATGNTVKVYDNNKKYWTSEFNHESPITYCYSHHDLLAISSQTLTKVWSLKKHQLLHTLNIRYHNKELSIEKKLLFVIPVFRQALEIWDLSTGSCASTISLNPHTTNISAIYVNKNSAIVREKEESQNLNSITIVDIRTKSQKKIKLGHITNINLYGHSLLANYPSNCSQILSFSAPLQIPPVEIIALHQIHQGDYSLWMCGKSGEVLTEDVYGKRAWVQLERWKTKVPLVRHSADRWSIQIKPLSLNCAIKILKNHRDWQKEAATPVPYGINKIVIDKISF